MRTLLVLLALTVPAVLAAEAEPSGQVLPDYFGRGAHESVRVLPAELFADHWAKRGLPALGYADGEDWQALVCDGRCTLAPVKLRTKPAEVMPYDSEPIEGQTVALDPKLDGTLIALLRGVPAGGAGTLPTSLHAGMGKYPPSGTPGTLEIPIPALPGVDALRIVPRRARAAGVDPELKVYLESKTQRQLLGSLSVDGIVGFGGMARDTTLLRWAGDIDRDGRLDLVMSFSNRLGELVTATVYLSSAAEDGELVHPVATFYYFPVELAGC